MMVRVFTLALLATLQSYLLQAQTTFRQTGNSTVTISGSSTLRNWSMTSSEPRCQAVFELAADGTPVKLISLSFYVRSKSLKSDYTAMDKNAYSSLNADEFKAITFDAGEASINGNKIRCTGTLSIAGVTHTITLDATYQLLADKTLVWTGTRHMNMTDFDVDPPSFMFGTVQTSDAITISFRMLLAPR